MSSPRKFRWRAWTLIGSLSVVAVSALIISRDQKEVESNLAELKRLGIPASFESLRDQEQGGVSIQEFQSLLVKLRGHVAYGPWSRSSSNIPGRVGIKDLARTQQLQSRMQPEFDELRHLIRKARSGISWNWPDGNGWNDQNTPQFFQDAHRLAAITRRRMATELAAHEVDRGLESAKDLLILAEQLQKVPGLMLASRALETHSYAHQGLLNAMQLKPSDPATLALVEQATQTQSPKVDLRRLQYEGLIWAKEHVDKPTFSELSEKVRAEGAKTIAGELGSYDPELEAQIVKKFLIAYKRLYSHGQNIQDFRAASLEIEKDLKTDVTASGIAVSRAWRSVGDPDVVEVLALTRRERNRWALTRATLKVLQHRRAHQKLPESLKQLDLDVDTVQALKYKKTPSGFRIAGPENLLADFSKLP